MAHNTILLRSFVLLWLFGCIAMIYQAASDADSLLATVFVVIASMVWATLFSLPTLGMSLIANKHASSDTCMRVATWAVTALSYAVIVFLIANFKLFSLYGFYTNFFVINLITTPGGVEAMGISTSTWITALGFVAIGALVFFGAVKYLPLEILWPTRLSKKIIAAIALSGFATQGAIYVYADYVNIVPVLNSADRILWYMPITADSLLTDIGFPRNERPEDELSYSASAGNLNYFDTDLLTLTKPEQQFNVVWLVAESWRADTVNAEVMPNTVDFANREHWFQNHYSGGNGTRMGIFTQFYGLYGHYWFDVLRNRQPPLLMEQLRHQGYDFGAFTSSAFTYPEFDKTVFSGIAASDLQEFSEGHGWERDQKNVSDLIEFVDQAQNPFFAFMFFESAHANYYFPDEDIIREDYLKDFNYLTVDMESSMGAIKNRYLNAVHHLDRQLARVYEALKQRGLMENTIVIVTGDHGEEFMENGRWGHNSTFSQPQIRVPLIVHIPGQAPGITTDMTSHLDIPATVFAALGAPTDSSRYSFGNNLLAPDYNRDFLVVSDWHGNTLVTPELKIIFSLKGAAYDAKTTDINDNSINLTSGNYDYQNSLSEYLTGQNRFFQ